MSQNKTVFGISKETVIEETKSGTLQAAELFSQEGIFASLASVYSLVKNIYALIATRKKK